MRRFVESGAVAFAMALFVWVNIGSSIIFGGNIVKMPTEFIPVENAGLYEELDNYISRANNHLLFVTRKKAEKELKEQIAEEISLGEMEMLAQLIEAEAGNQDFTGKCLVADVVLNRIDDGWGETVEDIIFMDSQFSVIFDGAYDKAAWEISEDSFNAAQQEYLAKSRVDGNVLYFTAGRYGNYGKPAYRHGNHYFCY